MQNLVFSLRCLFEKIAIFWQNCCDKKKNEYKTPNTQQSFFFSLHHNPIKGKKKLQVYLM